MTTSHPPALLLLLKIARANMDQIEAAIVKGRKLSEGVGEGDGVSQGSNGR